jgi:Kef-type K+ transport system membrane component KefB
MAELFFLPKEFPSLGPLLWFGTLVLVAMLAGEVLSKALRLPRIIGFVFAGILLGPQFLDFVNRDALFELRGFLDVARGLVLFELGQRVDFGWLRRNPWLLASSLLEASFSFIGVAGVLLILDVQPLVAATAAAIAMGTSPAVVLAVSKETRAQGQLTERLLMLTALNSIYAILAATMLVAWLHLEYRGGWSAILLHPLYLIAGALALATALAAATLRILGTLGRRADAQFLLILAMVVLGVALAAALRLSMVLTLLAFGVLTRVLDRDRRFLSLTFGREGLLVMVVLFSMTGASLEFRHLAMGFSAAVALIAVRALGKATALFATARHGGLSLRKASLLAIALTPMSGTALILAQDFYVLYPEFGPELNAVMISTVVILELFGPLAVYFALRRAKEAA